MSHKRSEIRQRLRSKLNDHTLVKGNVFCNMLESLASLPAIVIQTPKEDAAKFCETPRVLERRCYIVIEAIASGDGLDEKLDQITKEIEQIISHDLTFSGLVSDVVLRLSEEEYSSEGAEPIGSVKLMYEAKYHTNETPELKTTDFAETAVKFN